MSATAVQVGQIAVGVGLVAYGAYTLNPMMVMAGGSMVAGGDAPAPALSAGTPVPSLRRRPPGRP